MNEGRRALLVASLAADRSDIGKSEHESAGDWLKWFADKYYPESDEGGAA